MRQAKLVIAVVATVSAIGSTAQAYRTAGQLPSIASATPVRWAGQSYAYVVTNRAPFGLTFTDYQKAIAQALATWTQTECGSLGVHDWGPVAGSAKPGDGLNTIEWIPSGWAERGFDPSAPGQTDVMYEQDTSGRWVIKEADIYLNGEGNVWDLGGESASSAWSVRSVVLHEGGHAVGLLHPCEIVASAMAPACSSSPAFDGLAMNPIYSPSLTALSADDVAGVCSIYPKGLCVDRVCTEAETCTGGGCRLTCGNSTCDEGKVCSAGVCVDPDSIPPPIVGAPKDMECSASADCQRGLSCVAGTCQGGLRRLGDLCDKDIECQEGVCTSTGYCAEACQAAGDCSELNASCIEVVGGIGACVGSAKPIGSACDSADDCVGTECLVDGERAPVCTRACDRTVTPCPSGWNCAEVEGKGVCITAPGDSGCSCRFGTSSRQSSSWALPILAMISVILRRGQGGSRRAA